jgi:hypothetical protein
LGLANGNTLEGGVDCIDHLDPFQRSAKSEEEPL